MIHYAFGRPTLDSIMSAGPQIFRTGLGSLGADDFIQVEQSFRVKFKPVKLVT